MFKILKIVLIVLILGGGAYYFLNYDKENKENNSFVDSTKEFGQDVVDGTKDVLKGAK